MANGKHVLIDGQQRVTALMAAISGIEVMDDDFKKDRIKIAFNPLTEDPSKRFEVQDVSHLRDKKWIPDIAELFKPDFKPEQCIVPKDLNNAVKLCYHFLGKCYPFLCLFIYCHVTLSDTG